MMKDTKPVGPKPGDTVWAYAYGHIVSDKKMKPTKGALACAGTKQESERLSLYDCPDANYFVPFLPGTNLPDWQHVCPLGALCFTSTEQEAVTGYNVLVRSCIDKARRDIAKFESDLIPASDT